jgi:hypothetical protein
VAARLGTSNGTHNGRRACSTSSKSFMPARIRAEGKRGVTRRQEAIDARGGGPARCTSARRRPYPR